jgi:hypothetical protein
MSDEIKLQMERMRDYEAEGFVIGGNKRKRGEEELFEEGEEVAFDGSEEAANRWAESAALLNDISNDPDYSYLNDAIKIMANVAQNEAKGLEASEVREMNLLHPIDDIAPTKHKQHPRY